MFSFMISFIVVKYGTSKFQENVQMMCPNWQLKLGDLPIFEYSNCNEKQLNIEHINNKQHQLTTGIIVLHNTCAWLCYKKNSL